jgi:uncharacterized protein with gpF-like domain
MKDRNLWEQPLLRTEAEYAQLIYRAIREYFSAPIAARILQFSEWLDAYAESTARKMVTGVMVANARTWRTAASQSMHGREIFAAMQSEFRGPVGVRFREIVAANAELIRSLPIEIATKVTRLTARRTMEGLRPEAVQEKIAGYTNHLARWHSQLIARTETSKASTALTQARSESLNFKFYIWRSSQDSRVRTSHRFMANQGGIICAWDDPPSPEKLIGERSTLGNYAPGNCPNCRCYPEVLLQLDQVKWPHRVFAHGQVRTMSRTAFGRIAGIAEHVAA